MSQSKQQHYAELAQQAASLVADEPDMIANMANIRFLFVKRRAIGAGSLSW